MIKLLTRAASLVVGFPNEPSQNVSVNFTDSNSSGINLSQLDFEFHIEKTLNNVPNKCDVKVYGLSEATRTKFSGVQKLTVQVDAGYLEQTQTIYLGEVTSAWSERRAQELVTCFESGSKAKEIRNTRINKTVGAKIPISQAIGQIASSLGLTVGSSLDSLSSRGVTTINGSAMTGSAAKRLTDICRSVGLEWSIQDNVLQILEIGQPLKSKQSIVISDTTGMINSPKVDTNGVVKATCLLIPGLVPGGIVEFDTKNFKGGYKILKCVYKGQTFGNDWYNDFTAIKY